MDGRPGDGTQYQKSLDTAPYFHDNSARNLDEMLEQHDFFFLTSEITGQIALTPQDNEDIKAFLRSL